MTPTTCKLVSISYDVRYTNDNISETEKLQLRGMLALLHLGGLGALLAHLTDPHHSRNRGDLPLREIHAREDEFEAGLNALGELIAAIAGEALSTLDEAFDLKEQTK